MFPVSYMALTLAMKFLRHSTSSCEFRVLVSARVIFHLRRSRWTPCGVSSSSSKKKVSWNVTLSPMRLDTGPSSNRGRPTMARLLRWRDADGRIHDAAVPDAELHGEARRRSQATWRHKA